ncbi:MAG: hypothetical protein WBV93_15915 [Anaerobacillus sp.]
MAIGVGYVISCLGALVAYQLSSGKSTKRNFKVWGIALMVPISPALSFAMRLTYAVMVQKGWAGLIMWYISPFLFLIGLSMFLVGIFRKKEIV